MVGSKRQRQKVKTVTENDKRKEQNCSKRKGRRSRSVVRNFLRKNNKDYRKSCGGSRNVNGEYGNRLHGRNKPDEKEKTNGGTICARLWVVVVVAPS